MRNWKQKTKGVISVFLIIIFLGVYLLTGLLVDGGRYRMAKAMAESSLDTAGNSVLSYYNKLVYDLYGLMATDPESVSEDQIRQLFENYVDGTLQSAKLTKEELGFDLAASVFDGYDFETEINAGFGVTLADPENVEYQIIEHMKYRAPLELTAGAGSFLKKLESIVGVKGRISAARDKVILTEQHRDLFKNSALLQEDVRTYLADVEKYRESPSGESGGMEGIVSRFDEGVAQIKALWEEYQELQDEEEDDEDVDNSDEMAAIVTEIDEIWIRITSNACGSFGTIAEKAQPLREEGTELIGRVHDIATEYEGYIKELQDKANSTVDSEDYKTVFGPEVEIARGNCGAILSCLEPLAETRSCLAYLADQDGPGAVTVVGDAMARNLNPYDINNDSYVRDSLNSTITIGYEYLGDNWGSDPQGGVHGSMAILSRTMEIMTKSQKTSLVDVNETVNRLFSKKKTETDDKKSSGIDTSKAKKELENDLKEKNAIGNLDTDDLTVEETPGRSDTDNSCDFESDITATKDTSATMEQGLNIIEHIIGLLEGLRDDVYVNEYILTSFPNLVDHYYNADKSTFMKKLKNEPYSQYNANYAEVEYILTGEAEGTKCALKMEGRLLGIRTIMNMAAIFTDTGKVSQANAMASISGPLAPLISVTLLAAWALAESVMDVQTLMEGGSVPFFKQGADWTISVEGLVKKSIEEAVSYVADSAVEKFESLYDEYAGKVQNISHQAVYDVYQRYEQSVDDISGAAQSAVSETMNQWVEANSGLSEDVREANRIMSEAVSAEVSDAAAEVKNWGADQREGAIAAINRSFDHAEKKVKGVVSDKISKAADEVREKLTSTITEYLPGELDPSITTGKNKTMELDYLDYVRIFLLFTKQETKIGRIQSLVQANIRHGGSDKDFKLNQCYTGVWADMDCTIKFLFMSEPIVPSGLKQEGRLKFTVHSSRTY